MWYPEKKLGATFSAVRGLVNFPQYQQNFIDLYCFLTSSHFFKVVYKMFFWAEYNNGKAQKFIRQQQ